jgi:hypothetical protein
MKVLSSILLLMTTGMMVFLTGPASADEQELESIRQAIRNTGATWTAGDNWIMQMAPEDRHVVLGGNLPDFDVLPDGSMLLLSIKPTAGASLSSFDWRSQNGSNWMTSVKNQESCGSCAAFASIGSLEAILRITKGDPNLSVDLSEQHLFSCGGGNCTNGWTLDGAASYLQSYGVPDEACLPYTQSDNNCYSTCSDWASRAVKITSWSSVTNSSADTTALKNAISSRPIPCRMAVWQDFYSYSGGVYQYTSGTLSGYHFVVLVGWDDAQDCWICKNSWGGTWGESGYFRIKTGQVEIGTYAVSMVTASSPPPSSSVEIRMPSQNYRPGDTFYCNVAVKTGTTMTGSPLVVILEAYGSYYFAPSWVNSYYGIDYYMRTFTPPETVVQVLPAFSWPDGTGSASGIRFLAAITSPSLNQVYSNVAQFTFGWSCPTPSQTATPASGAVMPKMVKEKLKGLKD